MSFSIVDLKSTILVTRSKDGFLIKDLSTGETVDIDTADCLGICFKYETDFRSKFISVFEGKEHLIIDVEAYQHMTLLISFNRNEI